MKANINHKLLLISLITICIAATCTSANACIPPCITILSPENKIYATNTIPLNFTIDKPLKWISWIGYSLDGQTNITISGNTTLTDLEDGAHCVIVYANDTCWGLMGASETVCFTVDTTPPNITNIIQLPPTDNVFEDDDVKVNATVTDDISGVKQVTLSYTCTNSNETWSEAVNMTNLEGDIWNATIPKFPYPTNVTYTITAEDNVGNANTTEEMAYSIQFEVIPEYSPLFIVSMFIITTLLTITAFRKKHDKNFTSI
jgi:hypothetical protein